MQRFLPTIAALILTAASVTVHAEPAPAKDAANAAATTTSAAAATTVAVTAATPAGLTRAQVIAQVLEARKNGTLIETEADMDVAQTRKHYAK